MGKTVPLKLEDGTVIGSAVIHEHGRTHTIDATIDTSTSLGKKIHAQLTKGLMEGLSYDPVREEAMPVIKGDEWKNELLRLTPPFNQVSTLTKVDQHISHVLDVADWLLGESC